MRAIRLAWARATRTKPICKDVPQNGLKRCLRLRDVVGFGLGVTIGGGIFVAVGEAVREAGPAVIFSFLLAASGCACSGLCYAEMSQLSPSAGSSYSFSYNAVGELAAFIVGIVNIVGNILSGAAVARGWASYVQLLFVEVGVPLPPSLVFFPLGDFSVSPAAGLLVLLLWIVNLFGVETTATLNGFITAASVVMLSIFIFGSLPAIDAARWRPFAPAGTGGVFRGAGTVFFAYLGFDVLACLGEEAEDPRVVPSGIVWTLVVSTALYCGTALTFTGLVTAAEVEVAAPLASASRVRGLDAIALCVSVGAVGNTMTTVVGGILGAPRVCYVMSQDGLLPQALARVNERGAPVAALFWTAMPTLICALFLDFGSLADIVSAGALCSFSLVCVAVIILRLPVETESHRTESASLTESRARDLCTEMGAITAANSDLRPTNCSVPPVELGRPGSDRVGQDEGDIQSGGVADATSEQADIGAVALDGAGDVVSLQGLEAVGETSLAARAMGRRVLVYAALCLSIGLLARMQPENVGASLLAIVLFVVVVLGAAAVAVRIAAPFRRPVGGAARADESESGVFQLPLMPLFPLLGILMNMLLLSELPLIALWRTLGVVAACCAAYLGYAAPRSRLEDSQKIELVST